MAPWEPHGAPSRRNTPPRARTLNTRQEAAPRRARRPERWPPCSPSRGPGPVGPTEPDRGPDGLDTKKKDARSGRGPTGDVPWRLRRAPGAGGLPMRRDCLALASLALASCVATRTPERRDYQSAVGEGFTFRPAVGFSTDHGYMDWSHFLDSTSEDSLPTAQYEGTRGKLTGEVVHGEYGTVYRVAVLENDQVAYVRSGIPREFGGRSDVRSLDETGRHAGITLDSKLQAAERLFGKKVWFDSRLGIRHWLFSATTGQEVVNVMHCEPLVVVGADINQYGWARGAGHLNLVVRTVDGEEGLVPFHHDYLFLENPIPESWPPAIRVAIQKQDVAIGMTAEQVRLSWGQPKNVNTTVTEAGRTEQWVYSGQYVYLDNGSVESIQTSR